MKITEIIKKELSGWRKREISIFLFVTLIIIINAVVLKDNIFAMTAAFCGILYTILAGKGKVSCYIFGVLGSSCYSYLSLRNGLYGNLILYLFYYIPSQICGFFSWNRHLKSESQEIIKSRLDLRQRILIWEISVSGTIVTVILLYMFNGSHPIVDGITTFLSIIGMYLTVKRCIEQWFMWMIVNGVSFIMWLNIILSGGKSYSTLVMWGTYFILAFYFYREWRKELTEIK